MRVESVSADAVNALLPQTQCRQCGFDGCAPYSEAIASGEADIDRCPPGGAAGVAKLADLLGRECKPLNPLFGVEALLHLASIEEEHCIGCTLCIQACPVDAIVGAPKQMHTVIASLCTGCKLCILPCPVDCIRMEPASFAWSEPLAGAARRRFELRKLRLAAEKKARLPIERKSAVSRDIVTPDPGAAASASARRKAIIDAAVERARKLREHRLA